MILTCSKCNKEIERDQNRSYIVCFECKQNRRVEYLKNNKQKFILNSRRLRLAKKLKKEKIKLNSFFTRLDPSIKSSVPK